MPTERRATAQGWDKYEAVVAAAYDREELMPENDIPESVLDTLAAVRESGLTNMIFRKSVIAVAFDLDCDDMAVAWLDEHRDRYMAALRAMGERRQAET